MDTPLLQFENVTFAYPDSPPVIENATFSVHGGSYILIRGISGIGKSTILRLLCRLEEPTSGAIKLEGVPVTHMDPPLLRRKVCYVQQTPTIVQGSIRDNLLLAFSFKCNAHLTVPADEHIEKQLDDFFLKNVALDKPAADLSVGQKQRLCFIRSIMLKPSILLLDEPTSALDLENAAIVYQMTEKLNQTYGVTVFMVTHSDLEINTPGAQILEIKDREVKFL